GGAPEDAVDEVVIRVGPIGIVIGVRPRRVVEQVVVGVRPEHRPGPGHERGAAAMAPREPRRDPFGAHLAAGPMAERRGEAALPCSVRARLAQALRLPIGLRRGQAEALLALLRPQGPQLLLLLLTRLPQLCAIEMTSLLRACLPLLRAQ